MDDIHVQNKDDAAPVDKKFMDAKFYNAAVGGNIEVLMRKEAELDRLLTPCNNTILHIHILARRALTRKESTQFLERVLEMCPSLLSLANTKGETPLHLAARCGDREAVEVLVQPAKSADEIESGYKQEMLWVTNNEKDTALHEAVRMKRIDVVRLLIGKAPNHSYSANVAGETPLYMAVRRGYNDIASEILERCTSLTHKVPRGTTTLHAAVFTQNYEMTKKLLEATGCTLTKEVDDDGWTPLHYSARRSSFKIFVALLEKDKSAAYIPSKKEQWTALNVAIRYRRFEMMKELILHCPDCVEVVDRRGWNVFHHAAHAYDGKTWGSLLRHPMFTIQLINDKDVEGNTPLHHVAATNVARIAPFLLNPDVDKDALSNKNRTPLDHLLPEEEDDRPDEHYKMMQWMGCQESVRSKIIEDYKERLGPTEKGKLAGKMAEMREAHLVVATLIATVTFAAGFTLPGGYISDKGPDQGLSILSRKVAFQAFIVSDTIAMAFSTCAVFIHLLRASELRGRRSALLISSNWAFFLTGTALVAMLIAFATGTYAVLGHSKSLAISIIVMTTFFFSCFGLGMIDFPSLSPSL